MGRGEMPGFLRGSQGDVPAFLKDRRHPFFKMSEWGAERLQWREPHSGVWLGVLELEILFGVTGYFFVVMPGYCNGRSLEGRRETVHGNAFRVVEEMLKEAELWRSTLARLRARREGVVKARVDARNARRAWLWR